MEKTDLEKLTPEQLVSLSESNTTDFRWNRSEIYKIAFSKYEKIENKEKLEEMRKEILVFDLSTHNSPKVRFDAMITGKTDEGEDWKYPDFEKHFADEYFEYYKVRANTTSNDILYARYCDVIWEKKRDIAYARKAIEAYLATCPIYFSNVWDKELSDSLERALTLAVMISDQNLIRDALKECLKNINLLMEGDRPRYVIDIIKVLLSKNSNIGSQLNHDQLISVIESAIQYYKNNMSDSYNLQRSFMQLLIETYTIQKKPDEAKKVRVRIADSFIEEGDWKKTNYPNGDMVAASVYESALKAYLDLGTFPEKVEELKVKILQANDAASKGGYKEMTTTITIPNAKIDGYMERYKGKSSLDIIKIMAIDKSLIPSYDSAMETAKKNAQEFALQHIIPTVIMKGKITIKRISGDKDKLEYGAITNFKIGYQMTARILLNKIFDLLKEHKGEYIEELTNFVCSCEIITPERCEFIKRGIKLFQSEDYVSSIHVLIFQIEGILRDLLGKLGLPTFSYRNNEMREKMLDMIISNLTQVKGIDQDFFKFIEIYLCDIRGDNFRNDVAHGLLPISAFTRENVELLILVIIKLAAYKIVPIKEEI